MTMKLRAEDSDDLRVIAAFLQDALVPVSDIEYVAADRRFLLIANRFCWENCSETVDMPTAEAAECGTYERVNCAIVFDNIDSVRRKNFEPGDRGRILELLTMEIEQTDGPMAITMLFAGGAAIRIEGRGVKCRIGDLGEPWPTQWRPSHPLDTIA